MDLGENANAYAQQGTIGIDNQFSLPNNEVDRHRKRDVGLEAIGSLCSTVSRSPRGTQDSVLSLAAGSGGTYSSEPADWFQAQLFSNVDDRETKSLIGHALQRADDGTSLLIQSEQSGHGGLEILQRAILELQWAVKYIPKDHPKKPVHLVNFGNALYSRFTRLSSLDDLETAISIHRSVADHLSDGHLHKPTALSNFGIDLAARFYRLGNHADLENAIASVTYAAILTLDEHVDKPVYLKNLGSFFEARFDQGGKLEDLEDAIKLSRRAASLATDGHPEKQSCFSTLANALERRFERLGRLEDLEEAVSLKSRVVDLTDDSHPMKPDRLTDFGNILEARFDRLGHLKDIESAIALKRRALELVSRGHHDEAKYYGNLGSAFQTRFLRLGDLDDLENAIATMRRAVDLTPDDNPALPNRLMSLGEALETRYRRLREASDIDGAISFKRRATQLAPDEHRRKPGYLSSLGGALQTRFDLQKSSQDLENAIIAQRAAVDASADNPGYMNNLSISYSSRFEHHGELNDLQTAITLVQRAIDLTPSGHPDQPGRLGNLAQLLSRRYQRTRKSEDLAEAIAVWRRAVDLTPNDHPDRGYLQVALGQAIWTHCYYSSNNISDLSTAFQYFSNAADLESAPPSLRFWAAKRCVSFCWLNRGIATRDKLLPMYERAMALIAQVVWLGYDISRRYKELIEVSDIANAGAAAAIAAGKYTLAVEWLEEGRAIVWGQLLQLRNPMKDLSQKHPDLAKQLQDVSRALDTAGSGSKDGAPLSADGRQSGILDEVSYRTNLARQYSSLLKKIREQEGFENFLSRKKFTEIVSSFRGGPVVILNEHGSRCDALVLCSPGHIIHVPLLDLTELSAESMRSEMVEYLTMSGVRSRGLKLSSGGRKQNTAVICILELLWSRVVCPVLRAIEGELFEYTIEELPHITWCPNGRLGFLPLHAAGDYSTRYGNKVYDFVVSSYAPSLSSLKREDPDQPAIPSPLKSVLIVSQPTPPDFAPNLPALPGVREEVNEIKAEFGPGGVVHLDKEKATIQAVLGAMKETPSQALHLACHGLQEPHDPLKSAFALHDGMLELSVLMSKTTTNGVLAVLSACETAQGDISLSEEAVHLAAGMLAVGYRAVVGTLWSISDSDAPHVSRELYSRLRAHGGRKTAYVLHEAVKKLRERIGEDKVLRWAPFVHFG